MTQVVELTGEEAALLRSYDRAIKKQVELETRLREGGAAGDAAGTAIEAALARVERESAKALKGFLGELKNMGPEGAAAADAMKGHFQETGKAGFRSMETVLERIRQIDPQAASAAAAAQKSLKDAANSSEKQFHEVLDELRALGPQGRKTADEIKAKFVEAGKLSEKSIESIAQGFEKIDPEAAKLAKSVIKSADDGKASWTSFSDSAVQQITGMALAYVGVQEVIGKINEHLEAQRELLRESRNEHLQLGAVQGEAYKNLVGFSKAEQQQLLVKTAPDILGKTGFPSLGGIVSAIGAAGSADASFAEIPELVEAAARLTKLSPDQIEEYTMGAFNLSKITGAPPIESLNAMLTAGGKALVKDAKDVAETLPVAVTTANNVVKGGDPVTNAREAMAFYALSTDVGGDVTGETSKTNVTKITSYLAKLFEQGNKELNTDLANAQKAVAKQESKVSEIEQKAAAMAQAESDLKAKQARIEQLRRSAANATSDNNIAREQAELVDMRARLSRPKKPLTTQARARAQKQLAAQELKIRQMQDASAARGSLASEEAQLKSMRDSLSVKKEDFKLDKERAELATLKADLEKLQAKVASIPQDPGTHFARLRAVQENDLLRAQFLAHGDGGIGGDERFLSTNRMLVDPNSDAFKTLNEKFEGIKGGRAEYDKTIEQNKSGTSSTSLATSGATAKAAGQLMSFGTEGAILQDIREQFSEAMRKSNPGGTVGFLERVGKEGFNPWSNSILNGSIPGDTPAEEGLNALAMIQGRRTLLRRDGVTDDEQMLINGLDLYEENIRDLLTRSAERGDIRPSVFRDAVRARRKGDAEQILTYDSPEEKKSTEEWRARMDALLTTLERIAESNEKMVAPAQVTATNTGKLPIVTPQLSENQP